jgi:pimeloyl-ACP methyl ester carboxylesterase
VPGRGTTWVIVVHGWGAPRAEALPLMPLLSRLRLPTLVISYRNDPGVPPSPDRLSHLGDTEWHDLAAAVAEARRRGASKVVLVGYSMGGAMVCNLLRFSPLRRFVDGAVLDAPVLEWDRTLSRLGGGEHLPGPIMWMAKRIVAARIGFSFDRNDQLAHERQLRVPLLVLHGTDDRIVPIADSRALARDKPSVRLVTFPGAGHADSWRSNPSRYAGAVAAFLRSLGVGIPPTRETAAPRRIGS